MERRRSYDNSCNDFSSFLRFVVGIWDEALYNRVNVLSRIDITTRKQTLIFVVYIYTSRTM